MTISKYRVGVSCVALSLLLAACVPSQVVNINIVGDGSSLSSSGNGDSPNGQINIPSGKQSGGTSNVSPTPSSNSGSPTPSSSPSSNAGSPSPAANSPTPGPVYSPNTGVVTTLAGSQTAGYRDAVGKNAQFRDPRALVVDNRDGSVYVLDYGNYRIRKIAPDGTVTTIAGSGTPGSVDGVGAAAQFSDADVDMTMDNSGDLIVLDQDGSLRKVTTDGVVSTIRDNNGQFVRLPGVNRIREFEPAIQIDPRITFDSAGNLYYMQGFAVAKVDPNWSISTIAGSVGTSGYNDGSAANARFYEGLLSVTSDGSVYVANMHELTDTNNPFYPVIQKINPAYTLVSTLAGGIAGDADGLGTAAGFEYGFAGIVQDGHGSLFVLDPLDHKIRQVRTSDGNTTTLAGGQGGYIDGTGANAAFQYLDDVTIQDNGTLYVIDGNSVRKIQ